MDKQPSDLFLEIARQYAGKKKDTYIQWCDICAQDTEQTCMDKGLDEVYTCCKCGHIHSVRVR